MQVWSQPGSTNETQASLHYKKQNKSKQQRHKFYLGKRKGWNEGDKKGVEERGRKIFNSEILKGGTRSPETMNTASKIWVPKISDYDLICNLPS